MKPVSFYFKFTPRILTYFDHPLAMMAAYSGHALKGFQEQRRISCGDAKLPEDFTSYAIIVPSVGKNIYNKNG